MYHPAGVWHRVECMEDSIAVNISLIAASYAEVFTNSLLQMLLTNEAWRKPVCGSNEQEALGVMKCLLQDAKVLHMLTRVHILLGFCVLT